MARLRSAYTHHYRRMLPLILKALEFRSDSPQLKPVMEASNSSKTMRTNLEKNPMGKM